MDNVMRGGVWGQDPVENDFHDSSYSKLHDQRTHESAALCGSCHDIVTPGGAHIERTFAEWQDTLFADVIESGDPSPYSQQCGSCHAFGVEGPIAEFEGVPADRKLHSHLAEGVDVAITDFPDSESAPDLQQAQRDAIASRRLTTVCSSMCVEDDGNGGAKVHVWLHNEGAGHGWPSGANADRRAWIELQALAGEPLATVFSSGVVEDGVSVDALEDPNLWLFRDHLYDADGMETHDFWEAVSYETLTLQAPEALGTGFDDEIWALRSYELDTMPEQVTSILKLRTIAYEVLDELIASGDLDAEHRDAFETWDIPSTSLTWPNGEEFDVVGFGSCVSISPGCQAPPLRDATMD
jgi:hypothetical protein